MSIVGIFFSAVGVILGAVGTWLLVYEEMTRAASFLKYRSSGEGKEGFACDMQRQQWSVRLGMRVLIWLRGTRRMRLVGPETEYKDLAMKIAGLVLLGLGFLCQLVGILVTATASPRP